VKATMSLLARQSSHKLQITEYADATVLLCVHFVMV